MELEQKLGLIESELKSYFAKATEEKATLGATLAETKTAAENLQKQFDALVIKMERSSNGSEEKSLDQELKENESLQRLMRDKRGSAILNFKGIADLERKTTITSTTAGSGTAGVLMPQMLGGIVPGAELGFTLRDLLPKGNTDSNAVSYVKENVFTNAASPQTEGSAKAESALTFTTATANVRTLAHWIPATKQVLDDFGLLGSYINRKLTYGLKYAEEQELLLGSGTGEHLSGLVTQATAFNTALTVASDGWEYVDLLRRAKQQVDVANEMPSDFIVMNPAEWASIELNKDTTGRYIAGNPLGVLGKTLWGLPVVVTNAMTAAKFLVGSRNQAQIFDRQGLTIEISTEHASYFTSNMVAIRCEERLAFACFRPAAFIYGSFTQSPA